MSRSRWPRYVTIAALSAAVVIAAAVAFRGRAAPGPRLGPPPAPNARATPPPTRATPLLVAPAATPPPADTRATPPPGSATPPPGTDPPDQVAAAFTTAYLTYRWDDRPDAVRLRCRPWDTDELDAALTQAGIPADQARRAGAGEVDQVAIDAVDLQDRATDHLDATVAAVVTVSHRDRPPETVGRFVDVRVVATTAGWLVAEADL